jgi:uncharacterized protein YoxC
MVAIEFLIQVAAGARDTVITKVVAADHGVFEWIAVIASAIFSLTVLVFTVVAVPIAWGFRKTYKKADRLLDRIHGDIAPIIRHATAISDNVNSITESIRTDVDKVSTTIASANDRVQQAVELTERRLHDFNALLGVVQDEAEDLFVSSASAVRAFRSGAAALRGESGMDLASEELDPALVADALERHSESQEEGDVDNGSAQSSAEAPPAAPRVRPRERGGSRGQRS